MHNAPHCMMSRHVKRDTKCHAMKITKSFILIVLFRHDEVKHSKEKAISGLTFQHKEMTAINFLKGV